MKKTYILICCLLSFWCFYIKAQYVIDDQDLLINDIYPVEEELQIQNAQGLSSAYNFYNDLKTWIPYCNSDPLKNPPITYIEISFHVFLDDNGGNNEYTDTPSGRERLLSLVNTVNAIYSGGWGPSDPVDGVVELPNYDTRIRFTLGENNERIYFYKNTTQNHEWNSSVFYNYVQRIYPERLNKLNVFFTAGYYVGKVDKSNIVITNGGTGYTSAPTISFHPSEKTEARAIIENGVLTDIEVTNRGEYFGFDPPQITISGGGGSGAAAVVTKLMGGATGYANPPYSGLFTNHHVVMLHCHESQDWIYGMTLAHELGHNLDLLHTFCGGGASAVCCAGDVQNCQSLEYLSDIFGSCPGNCPHISQWVDPYDNTMPNAEKITNNVMGGTATQVYFSPMQAGQMHRTLALKSTRKYVKTETYSSIPLKIENDETWNFNLKLYRDVDIISGVTLTISNVFELPYNGTLTVNDGAALVIIGTVKLSDTNKIVVKRGGTIKFSSASNIEIRSSGKIIVEPGAYFCVEQGANINLQDYNSLIVLKDGAILGANPVLFPNTPCISSVTNTGLGTVADYGQDIYIQNEIITSNRYIAGKNIFVGEQVITTKPLGNVSIINGAHVIFDATGDVIFDTGFECVVGSSFEIIKSQ